MICPTCKSQYAQGAFCANDGSALVADETEGLVGKVLAERYRIVRLVGEGGMGQVYEAHHVNINKRFALKLLRSEVVGSQQSLARFRQEAWAASSIGHENIVEIDDFATLPSGEVYLAMEFLEGQSLAERLRDGPPLGLSEALPLLIAVAHGLAAAHEKGIVHRDMKPENIFLARRGHRITAKILDFGIAKVTGSDEPSTLTRTGAIFGTPLYMSPEQAKGRAADARADVYALGVILYEVATGRVPFGGGSSVEILSQQIAAVPVPPIELAPERAIPPALEAVILRAMEKEPEARPQSMAELAAELETVAATLPREVSGARPLPPSRPVAQVHPVATPSVQARPMATPSQPMVARPGAASYPVATPSQPMLARPVAQVHPVATPSSDSRDFSSALATPSQPLSVTPPPMGPLRSAHPAAPDGPSANPPLTMPPPGATSPGDSALMDSVPPAGGARWRILAVVTAALLVIVGAVLLLKPRHAAAPAEPTVTRSAPPPEPPVTTREPVAPPAPAPPSPEEPPPLPVQHEVIVETSPPGARILRDGTVIGDTPDAVHVDASTRILLKKEGYADKWLTLAPDSKKQLVRLERLAKPPAPPRPPKPAPVATAAATAARPAATPPAPPPKPADAPLEPYGLKPVAAPPRAAAAAHKGDELAARIDKQAASVAPGGHRVGDVYKGSAPEEGGRSDWFVDLPANRCFVFFGEGGDGVKGLYLYLWNGEGKRVKDARPHEDPHPHMPYCTTEAGKYHVQVKISEGGGEYRLGIYQQR